MFFPISTSRGQRRTPWVNQGIIALNVIVFLLTMNQINALGELSRTRELLPADFHERFWVYHYYLQFHGTHWYQFVTYQFLHGGWMHLIGNMVFLYVFGNAVEDRLGRVNYLFFYLTGGVLAGMGNMIYGILTGNEAAVLGASGAVAAVTGAYLALFPLARITILYWFGIIGTFEVASIYLICFQVASDFVLNLSGTGNVAYMAHLTGYAFGFGLMMLLLLTRLLEREPYDMLAVLERRRRRRAFARMVHQEGSPWFKEAGEASDGQPTVTDPQQAKLLEARAQVSAALNRHAPVEAASAYRQLLALDASQVMGESQQLDLANQLMAESDYPAAATAYERLLASYRTTPDRAKIQLILALIHARYLNNPKRAIELLTLALPGLEGDDHRLATATLARLQA